MTTPRRLVFRFVHSLLLLALPAAALAQAVSVSVNTATTVRTVDERVFGLNAVMWDQQSGSSQTISLLQAAGTRTIRVPGGSLSDEYHWRNHTVSSGNWPAGFDKFADLITGLSAQTFVTVNYGTGTPEEAAAWVAYANAATSSTVFIGPDSKSYDWLTAGTWAALRGASLATPDDGMNFLRRGRSAAYGLKYWEIGNENYGTWETDEQANRHDPYTYATRAKVYIQKMKAVDPTIKVGVVVTARDTDYANGYTRTATNLRTGVVRTGWTPVMLATLRADPAVTPDFVIYHRYEQTPLADSVVNSENDANLLQKAKTWPDDVAAMRGMLTDYLGTAGANVEILVTENNSVYAKPGKQTTSLVNALYHADSVGHLLQTEINALLWWDLRNGQETGNNNSSSLYGWRNYGDYGILSSASQPYPTYYAMKLLSRFARQGDAVLAATSNNSLLTVFAAKTTGGAVNLLVINKDPATTREASIALTGFTPAASASVYAYGIPQDDAARTGSGSTDITSTTMTVSGATFTASFAPYSLTVLSLTAGTTPPAPTSPAPTTPPPSSGGGGGGGGGGGAPSLWFVGVLALLAVVRWVNRR